MTFRIGSKQEREEILIELTQYLIKTECKDLQVLKQVDRLCRRTWPDIGRGWVMWSYYLETIMGKTEYQEWARENCSKLKVRSV